MSINDYVADVADAECESENAKCENAKCENANAFLRFEVEVDCVPCCEYSLCTTRECKQRALEVY